VETWWRGCRMEYSSFFLHDPYSQSTRFTFIGEQEDFINIGDKLQIQKLMTLHCKKLIISIKKRIISKIMNICWTLSKAKPIKPYLLLSASSNVVSQSILFYRYIFNTNSEFSGKER
jgi:hypothetical protein